MEEVIINKDDKIRNQIFLKYFYRVYNPVLPQNFQPIKRFLRKPIAIVIHDINCLNIQRNIFGFQEETINIGPLKAQNILQDKLKDINYHFLVDKVHKDYEIVLGRPINRYCAHKNLSSVFEDSLHIIVLADLNIEIIDLRLYQILAYRCLAPLIKSFRLSSDPNDIIKLHKEVLKDVNDEKARNCPGSFLAKEMLVSYVRRFL